MRPWNGRLFLHNQLIHHPLPELRTIFSESPFFDCLGVFSFINSPNPLVPGARARTTWPPGWRVTLGAFLSSKRMLIDTA
jgi:hypothetical protein